MRELQGKSMMVVWKIFFVNVEKESIYRHTHGAFRQEKKKVGRYKLLPTFASYSQCLARAFTLKQKWSKKEAVAIPRSPRPPLASPLHYSLYYIACDARPRSLASCGEDLETCSKAKRGCCRGRRPRACCFLFAFSFPRSSIFSTLYLYIDT